MRNVVKQEVYFRENRNDIYITASDEVSSVRFHELYLYVAQLQVLIIITTT
jgi:hypothetical protein